MWRSKLLLPDNEFAPGPVAKYVIPTKVPCGLVGAYGYTPLLAQRYTISIKSFIVLITIFCLMLAGCRERLTPGLSNETGFSAVVFFTRAAPPNSGGLVAGDEFRPGGNVFLLSPASPGGALKNLTGMSAGDVQGIDVSPDGKRVIAALRTDRADRFHLVEIDLEKAAAARACVTSSGDVGPACRQLTFGPAGDTEPFYMQDGRIAFVRADPDGPVDFLARERARILMAIDADGSAPTRIDFGAGHALGARGLRTGWVRLVRWTLRQSQPVFMPMLVDPTGARTEQIDGLPADANGIPLAAEEDKAGQQYAVCVPANGTWGAGALCQRREDGQWQSIVADIPLSQGCSPAGRIHEATPLSDGRFLVSYANTFSGCLDASDELNDQTPDFALAILDPRSAERTLLHNTAGLSDLSPRPVMARSLLDTGVTLPQRPDIGCQENTVVFEGIIEPQKLADGAVRLRVLEGLSGAIAPWAMDLFGSEAGAICGGDNDGNGTFESFEAPVYSDGSFRFAAPASVPLRIQLLDAYGAQIATDPVWRGGPPCARRRCDGCHANEGAPASFGTSLAAGQAPYALGGPVGIRKAFDFRRDIQPILDASCVSCHGSTNPAGNYIDFNLQRDGVNLSNQTSGQTTVAYQNLLFYDVLRDSSGAIVQSRWAYVEPGGARNSRLVKRLGAPCRFECGTYPAWASWGAAAGNQHAEGLLTNEERSLIIDWIDAGAPFYGRGATP